MSVQLPVVLFSSIDWDAPWQGPQEVSHRLSKAGHPVLYVQNSGIRGIRPADIGRVAKRLRDRIKVAPVARDSIEGVRIHSPVTAPPFRSYSEVAHRLAAVPKIIRASAAAGPRWHVITFIPNDLVTSFLDVTGPRVEKLVYYCAADFPTLSDRPHALEAAEASIINRADRILAHTEVVANRLRANHRPVAVVPWGVDTESFEPKGPRPIQATPTVGYIGTLHRHLDIQLLTESVVRTPEWRWVFVGPIETNLGRLGEQPNVRFTGQRPHSELPDLIDDFDVCTVPYATTPYADTLVPVKINEYLAMGKPVVSTRIAYATQLADKLGIIDAVDAEAGSFVASIRKHLNRPSDPQLIDKRRQFALANSWDVVMENLHPVLSEDLSLA